MATMSNALRVLVLARLEEETSTVAAHFPAPTWQLRDVTTVEDAIDRAMEFQPHVIIVHCPPDGPPGYYFVRTLRTVVEHDIKIIGVGQLSSREHVAAGFDARFDHVADMAGHVVFDVDRDDDSKTTVKMRPLR